MSYNSISPVNIGFTLYISPHVIPGTDTVHLNELIRDPDRLDRYQLIGFPGGFSYGDDVAAGRVKAVKCRVGLWPALRDAAERGVPMIGVCNGFQVLAQLGLLPGFAAGSWPEEPPEPTIALGANRDGRFVDCWTRIEPNATGRCVWTRGMTGEYDRDALMLPIAHGEGRFVCADTGLLHELEREGRIAVAYAHDDNPNGSQRDVAGICDPSGRILGLMPHPERYLEWGHHPFATRLTPEQRRGDPPGLRMFRSAVEHAGSGAAM